MNFVSKSILLLTALMTSAVAQAKPITITHALGETTLQHNPERVVAIGVGVIDMLDYFGIDPVATSHDYLPTYLSKYAKPPYQAAGTLFEPDFETIYTNKPDVILIGPRAAAKYDELSEIAPTIIISPAESGSYWHSTQQQWRTLAEIFDISDKVESTIADIDKEFKSILEYNQHHPAKALTVMSFGGNITAFSENSRFASIYVDFGFTQAAGNLKAKRHGDAISFEFISEVNPKYLFVFDSDKVKSKRSTKTKEQFNNALITATQAYQNENILFVNMDAWYLSLGGVTATKQMVKDVETVLYDEQ